MDRSVGAAARLPESDRKDLALQALARSETVSGLAARHGVSRKFVYQQAHKAQAALDDAFSPAAPDDEVLFELAVTRAWLRQVIVGLALICRGSYRGVVEFLRDLLGVPVSLGCIHDVLRAATRQAGAINNNQELSGIRVGLHDEIFQGATPVLAGVDAASTCCYLLAAEHRRDADTWGVHLLDATQQGLDPDHTVADAGQGLRAGQRAAWGDTPCHGDVFHIQRQCEGLANTLARLAKGATSRRQTLQARIGRAGQRAPGDGLAARLALARQAETQAHGLARDIRTLTQWLRHRGKFHTLLDAASRAMADTPRSSSLVENLNSRLRPYFTLRRHLGNSHLDLLRFFLNHRRFLRSRRAERQGKSPRELMTGQGHPHWLTRGGEPPPAQDTLPVEIRPSQAGGFRAPCVTQKRQILNHAPGLPTAGRSWLGRPRRDRLVSEPHRQAAALAQAGVVSGPVRHPVLLARDVVTAVLVQLERQDGHPELRRRSPTSPSASAPPPDPCTTLPDGTNVPPHTDHAQADPPARTPASQQKVQARNAHAARTAQRAHGRRQS